LRQELTELVFCVYSTTMHLDLEALNYIDYTDFDFVSKHIYKALKRLSR